MLNHEIDKIEFNDASIMTPSIMTTPRKIITSESLLIKYVIERRSYLLMYADKKLLDDTNFMQRVCAIDKNCYHFASDRLKHNRDMALTQVAQNGDTLRFVSEALCDDYDIVHAAVSDNGMALTFASDRLKNDESIVLAALNNAGCAIQFADKSLRDRLDICVIAVRQDAYAIKYVPLKFQRCKKLIKRAIIRYPHLLSYAGNLFNGDVEIQSIMARYDKKSTLIF